MRTGREERGGPQGFKEGKCSKRRGGRPTTAPGQRNTSLSQGVRDPREKRQSGARALWGVGVRVYLEKHTCFHWFGNLFPCVSQVLDVLEL